VIVKSYKLLGGKHPETATVKNALASLGVKAPHTGKPFTEEMLLGIAGGLGMGYILWEFKKHNTAILVMAFQNKWNYPVKFLGNLCKRIGVKAVFKETSGTVAAGKNLKDALAQEVPGIVWVDQAHLPYLSLPREFNGCFGGIVNVYGYDEKHDHFLIHDLGKKLLLLSAQELAQARGRIPSYKNRLLLVQPPAEIDLKHAIIDGIQDCVDYLSAPSETFALPAIAKWAKLMTEAKNKKGWPVVFKKRQGLYGTLVSVYEGIEHKGTGGGGMRGMYADFLTEAAAVIDKPGLLEATQHYKTLAKMWTKLAEACLPDHMKPCKEVKALLRQKYQLLKTKGESGLAQVGKISEKLNAHEKKLNTSFPLSDVETNRLFAEIQEQLFNIHEAEKRALEALRAAL